LSQKRDYYQVLGVEPRASEQDLKSAYRKLALQHHPDRNPDDKETSEERFKEITEAYSILADSQKRAIYDRYGHAGLEGVAGSPDSNSTIDIESIFGDFFGFGDLFGSPRARRGREEHGADLRYNLEISFEEAAAGLEPKIKIPRWETCPGCQGSGARKGSAPITCPGCGGRGQIRHQQGFFSFTRGCPHCQGIGRVVRDPCSTCKGDGRVREVRVLSIKIPAGVEDGTRLRISGEGEAGPRGGPPGDLHVVLRVREHPYFERKGTDLYCTIPISIAQAALGADIKVDSLQGPSNLKIPEGTQSGSVLRMRGLGLPSVDGRGRGDLYVAIHVVVPTRLSREQRRLLEILGPETLVSNKPLERRASARARDAFG